MYTERPWGAWGRGLHPWPGRRRQDYSQRRWRKVGRWSRGGKGWRESSFRAAGFGAMAAGRSLILPSLLPLHPQRSCLCFCFSQLLPEAMTLTFGGSSTGIIVAIRGCCSLAPPCPAREMPPPRESPTRSPRGRAPPAPCQDWLVRCVSVDLGAPQHPCRRLRRVSAFPAPRRRGSPRTERFWLGVEPRKGLHERLQS